jgi:Resolvase, N terminal domain
MTETRIEQSGPTGRGDGVPRVQDRLVRYALYLRISTDESRQRWSLQAQEEKLREFVSYREGVVVAVYRDEASGASLNRPQLMKAIDDAAAGNFEVLAFYRLDHVFHAGNKLRLSQSMGHE